MDSVSINFLPSTEMGPGVARVLRGSPVSPSVWDWAVQTMISYVTESCRVEMCGMFGVFRLSINKDNTSRPCVAGSYSVFPGDCLLFKQNTSDQ